MGSVVSSITGSIVQSVVSGAGGSGSLSGRSVSCISTIAQIVTWTVTALAIVALVAKVFIFFFPVVLVMFPLLVYVIPVVLVACAIGSAIGALAIAKLTPVKQLETAINDLSVRLDAFERVIEDRLPAILKDLEQSDDLIAKAVGELSIENQELVKFAADFRVLLQQAGAGVDTLQVQHKELRDAIRSLEASVARKQQGFDAALVQVGKLNLKPLTDATISLERQAIFYQGVVTRQKEIIGLLQKLMQSVEAQKTAAAAINDKATSAADSVAALGPITAQVQAETARLEGLIQDVKTFMGHPPSDRGPAMEAAAAGVAGAVAVPRLTHFRPLATEKTPEPPPPRASRGNVFFSRAPAARTPGADTAAMSASGRAAVLTTGGSLVPRQPLMPLTPIGESGTPHSVAATVGDRSPASTATIASGPHSGAGLGPLAGVGSLVGSRLPPRSAT